ncbi:MAG: pyrroline-5-carboxylate reductase [Verrucomicrobia bacterium]|nr:pyrroline-5-carboxylate reductase [Cytophagales bacterium]
MHILITGAGNMGTTYARSLLSSHFATTQEMQLLIRSDAGRNRLPEIPDENVFRVAGDFIGQADIVIIAVKPQDYQLLAPTLQPFLQPEQLILSIMAGVSLQTLRQTLGVPKLIRAMPNLPSQIGMGMTVFSCSAELDRKELFIIQNLLNTTGKSLYVEDEKLIDSATAVSGSGPAYVYYFMNAMIKAGVELGFSEAQAELLVQQTFMGSVHLQNQNSLSCEELMRKVASKGGTTETAFKIFNEHAISSEIKDGILGAYQRSLELGK